jgi:hypothetical protein
MVYCRFSTDDMSCDVYVYQGLDNEYRIHIASSRVVGDIPKTDHLFTPETVDEYINAQIKRVEFLKTAERESIGLPHDGRTLTLKTAKEAALALAHLKEIGYRVPAKVIDTLEREFWEG